MLVRGMKLRRAGLPSPLLWRQYSSKKENSEPEPIMGPGAAPGTIASDFEGTVGVERLELLGKLSGRPIFDTPREGLRGEGPMVRGTLSDPILVDAVDRVEGRLVGCTGHPVNSHELGWFWVRPKQGAVAGSGVTRCPECGQAFKLRDE